MARKEKQVSWLYFNGKPHKQSRVDTECYGIKVIMYIRQHNLKCFNEI